MHYKIRTTRSGEFSGNGYIAGIAPGIVTVNNLGAARELEVRDRATRKVVDTMWSKSDGTYRFDNLNETYEYDIIGRDHNREYSDVVIPAIIPWSYTPVIMGTYPSSKIKGESISINLIIRGGEAPYTINNISGSAAATINEYVISIVNNSVSEDIKIELTDAQGFSKTITILAVGTLFEEVIEKTPYLYFRFNEAADSPTVTEYISGTQYTPISSPTLGNPPLHLDSPGSIRFSNNLGRIQVPASALPQSYTEFTIAAALKFDALPSATRIIATQGDALATSTQTWQFRTSSDSLQFVKVSGGVETVTSIPGSLNTGVPSFVTLTVDTSGSVVITADEKVVLKTSVGPIDYGSSTIDLGIGGYVNGGGGTVPTHMFMSDFAFYDKALTDIQRTKLIKSFRKA